MKKSSKLHSSPSGLSEKVRIQVIEELNQCLANGIDLYTQIKFAHWNIKGKHFIAVHPFLDKIIDSVAESNDEIAERAVTLGGHVMGTARQTAKMSTLKEYPLSTTQDLEHVRHVADRLEAYLEGARAARKTIAKLDDVDTDDLLTQAIRALEKHTWFLLATLDNG